MRPPTGLGRLDPGRTPARREPAARRSSRRGGREARFSAGGRVSARLDFTAASLRDVRRLVAREAERAWLNEDRRDDLVLAIDELATNSVVHGGGGGTLEIWRQQRAIACEVRDDGHIEDPLAGLRPPDPAQPTGRGLWIASRLCDRIQVSSSPGGTAVRVQMAER